MGVIFQLSTDGSTTALVANVTSEIDSIATPGTIAEVGPLAFGPLIKAIDQQKLYGYGGSLTTPPCTEGVTFRVTSQPLPLDVASFNSLKSVLGFNSRFIQNSPGQPNVLSGV
jgi:carbonic anhydrase